MGPERMTTMLTLRRSNERGAADHGWLDSRHTFSFAGYFDRKHMGYRSLRVINEDLIAAGRGFGMHPHDNMEIISYPVAGKLAHKDSAGHAATIGRNQVQFMSAGSGIAHSEFNPSQDETMHLLQIWIRPAKENTPPRYEDRDFTEQLESGKLALLVSPDGRDGSIRIGQDALLYGARLAQGGKVEHSLASGRGAWLQVISGTVNVNGETLHPGDAAAIEDVSTISINATEASEFLLFDLA